MTLVAAGSGEAAWLDLEALLEQDSSVKSIEFGHLGTAFDCRIRRDRLVHVIIGQGKSSRAALADALAIYWERDRG